ncbi:MAG: N-acetylmuramoyl-L-alanine amidase, partial [Spirochaetes bacterium]|nr:N-acetylmuramoyl-L-alanine amidase [Spirochaetota bacterium]
MLPITQMLLINQNRPKIKLKKLKGVVIHWTANTGKGANAIANRNYFNTTKTAASAHYIVDVHSIVQCVPDGEVAWHVGASKYTSTGEKIREKPYSPNYFLIGIEMCVNSDGNWNKTYQNTVELTAYLLKKYGLTINNLYRHYDITGKNCPAMMIAESEWTKFKNAVAA